MYEEVFEILIVSKSLWIEEALQAVKPLEDCTYRFTTYSDFSEFYKESVKKNTAVIMDSGLDSKQMEDAVAHWSQAKADGKEAPHTAVLFLPGKTEMSAGCSQRIDHIWLVNSENDAEALRLYFERLAADLKEKTEARKQAICFQTLIDSSQNLIWFKDVEGRHLIVNDEFCRFVDKSKEQIYKQGHCYIWNASEEDEKVCLESDHKIMLGKKTQKFEEQIHTNREDCIIQSYKSPLAEDGEIFGTCGIGQNVTSERNLEKKQRMILNQIPYAVAVVSNEDILTYKNKMFDIYFPEAVDCKGKDIGSIKRQLHIPEYLEEGETVEFKIQTGDEEPVWFSCCEKKILDAFDSQMEKMLIVQDITANKKLDEQKEIMAHTDYLTGLQNRRGMLERFRMLENDITELWIILIDIDNFKSINDTFGHDVGDEVLKKFAEALREVFPADMVIRYGGDEFLIATRLFKRENICMKMDKLMSEIEDIVYADGQQKGISISGGVSVRAEVGTHTLDDLIKMSDEAMYYSKKHGKNGYCFFDEMNK